MSTVTQTPQSKPSSRTANEYTDRWAIFDLVARFDDAVNRKDVPEFSSLWSDDAEWEILHPTSPLHVKGRDVLVKAWQERLGTTEWLFRGSFAGVVTLNGDEATGRWPCVETGTFAAHDGAKAQGYDNRAINEDRYVKIDGRWYFQRRRYLYLWLSEEDLPGKPIPLPKDN